MAADFQPEKPQPPAREEGALKSTILTAVASALVVVMLMALLVPRLAGDSQTNWALTVGAGVVTLVGVFLFSYLRRS